MQAMQGTPSNRVLSQDPNTQESILTNAKYGISPTTDENGNFNTAEAQKKSGDTIGQLSNGVGQILQAEGGVAPIQEVIAHAKHGLRQYAPASEWDEGDKHIEEIAGSYAKHFGDEQGNVPLHHVERMKHEMGPGAKFDASASNAKRSAQRSLYHGARNAITGHTKHKEFYNQAMKEEQRLIDGRKILKRLNGKKAPKTGGLLKELYHLGGRYAALYVGDKIGGPMGAIVGDMISRHVIKAADKRFGKTLFESPEMQKAVEIASKGKPQVEARIREELMKAGIEGFNAKVKQEGAMKKLMPGKQGAMITPPPTTFEKGAKGQGTPKEQLQVNPVSYPLKSSSGVSPNANTDNQGNKNKHRAGGNGKKRKPKGKPTT